MFVRRIPEVSVAGKPLGRHVRHDPQSLRYLAPAADPDTLTSVRHTRRIPVLDQGSLGSCTGNAALGAVGTSPIFEALRDVPRRLVSRGEGEAIDLYSAATKLDDYAGGYPPEDTGSDGLSVAKAALSAGFISGYTHATSLEAALTALATGPVIAGINWYDTFDQPDTKGLISIGKRAAVRGGHEICVDELDVENRRIGFTNSWGDSWGVGGRAYMSWDDFGRLLAEDGDVTVFVPLTQPAPTPTPPTPADPLAELAVMFRQWVASVEAWFKKHSL